MAREREVYLDKEGSCRFRDNNRLVHHEVAELKLGRKLKSGEEVHHIDGDRKNNNPFNLQIVKKEEHKQIHSMHEMLHHYQRSTEAQNSRREIGEEMRSRRRRALSGAASALPNSLLFIAKEAICILTAAFFIIGCTHALDFIWARLPQSGALGIIKGGLFALSYLFGLVIFILANKFAKPLNFTLKGAIEAVAGLAGLLVPALLLYALSVLLERGGFGLLESPLALLLAPCGIISVLAIRKLVKES
jgi:hypothetical protein